MGTLDRARLDGNHSTGRRRRALATLGLREPFTAEELARAKSQALREVHPDTGTSATAKGRSVDEVLAAAKYLLTAPKAEQGGIPCWLCDGTGHVPGPRFSPVACPRCHGNGEVPYV